VEEMGPSGGRLVFGYAWGDHLPQVMGDR